MAVVAALNSNSFDNAVAADIARTDPRLQNSLAKEIQNPLLLGWVQSILDKIIVEAKKLDPSIEANEIELVLLHSGTIASIVADSAPNEKSLLFVSPSLFEFARSEDEVAFVLSHEIGHLLYRKKLQISMNEGVSRDEEISADYFGLHLSVAAGYSKKGATNVFENLTEKFKNEQSRRLLSTWILPHCPVEMRYEYIKNDIEGMTRLHTGSGIKAQRETVNPIPNEILSTINEIEGLGLNKTPFERFLLANRFHESTAIEKLKVLKEVLETGLDRASAREFIAAFNSIKIHNKLISSDDKRIVCDVLDEIINTSILVTNNPYVESEKNWNCVSHVSTEIFRHATKLWFKAQENIDKQTWLSFIPIGEFKLLDNAVKAFAAAQTPQERIEAAQNYIDLEHLENAYGSMTNNTHANFLSENYKELESLRPVHRSHNRNRRKERLNWKSLTKAERAKTPEPAASPCWLNHQTEEFMPNSCRRNSPFRKISPENVETHPWTLEAANDQSGAVAIFLARRVYFVALERSHLFDHMGERFLNCLSLSIHKKIVESISKRPFSRRTIQSTLMSREKSLAPRISAHQLFDDPERVIRSEAKSDIKAPRYYSSLRVNEIADLTSIKDPFTRRDDLGGYWSPYFGLTRAEGWKVHLREAQRLADELQEIVDDPRYFADRYEFSNKLCKVLILLANQIHQGFADAEGCVEEDPEFENVLNTPHPLLNFVVNQSKEIIEDGIKMFLVRALSRPNMSLEQLERVSGVNVPEESRSLLKYLERHSDLLSNRQISGVYKWIAPHALIGNIGTQAVARILRNFKARDGDSLWRLFDEVETLLGDERIYEIGDHDALVELRLALRDIFTDSEGNCSLNESRSVTKRVSSLQIFERYNLFTSYPKREDYWLRTLSEISELSAKERLYQYDQLLRNFKNFPTPEIAKMVSKGWAASMQAVHGIDDKTDAYRDKLLAYLHSISRDIHFERVHQLAIEVMSAVVSQRNLTFEIREMLQKKAAENRSEGDLALRTMMPLIHALSDDINSAHETIDFLRTPLSEESVEAFSQKLLSGDFGADADYLQQQFLQGQENTFSKRSEERRLKLKFGLQQFHHQFWSVGLESRSYIIKSLLVNPKAIYENPEAIRKNAKDFALSRLFPSNLDLSTKEGRLVKIAREAIESHIDIVDETERSLIIGAILSSGMDTHSHQDLDLEHLGRRIAETFSVLGTAYQKTGQGFESYPKIDPALARGFKGIKSNMNSLNRIEFFELVDEVVPESELSDIEWFGPITNAASAYVVMQCQTDSGEKEALRIRRRFADVLAKKGFEEIRATNQLVCNKEPAYEKFSNHADRLLKRAEIHTTNELSAEAALRQYEIAKQEYPQGQLAEIDGYAIDVEVVPWKRWGDGWQRMRWAEGETFGDLMHKKNLSQLDQQALKASATPLFYLTAQAVVRGRRVDTDRHEDQVKLLFDHDKKRILIQLFDHGGMMLNTPSQEELHSLASRVPGSFLKSSQSDAAQTQKAIEDIIDIDLVDNDYLCDIRKTLLSAAYTIPYLDKRALKAMFTKLALREGFDQTFASLLPWWLRGINKALPSFSKMINFGKARN